VTVRTSITASYVVGFEDGEHVVYPDAELVIEDDEILSVGAGFDGDVDRTIDGDYLVMPGFVDLDVRLDQRVDAGGATGSVARPAVESADSEVSRAGVESSVKWAVGALLRSGTTTFVSLGEPTRGRFGPAEFVPELYADVVDQFGSRAYLGSRYRSRVDGGEAGPRWDPQRGREQFERARRFADEYDGTAGGRVRTVLAPESPAAVTRELLVDTREAAADADRPISIQFAESATAADQTLERHDATPVDYLDELDLLGPSVWLRGAHYPDGETTADGRPAPQNSTLDRLGTAGATVVHCPALDRRHGVTLRSATRYQDHGIGVALGSGTTQCPPVETMRWGSLANKWVEDDPTAGSAGRLFTAATVGGARALGRTDIGRLRPGAKADIVCIDLGAGHVGPVHDPIRSLVHTTTPADVEFVFVDGQLVVDGGGLRDIDEQRLLADARNVTGTGGST